MKQLKIEEFIKIGKERFGEDQNYWKFVCPMCGTEQSFNDLEDAGIAFTDANKYTGYSCIGRFTGKGTPAAEKGKGHGCNWTLGGFLQMHTLEVEDKQGNMHPYFDFAEEKDQENPNSQATETRNGSAGQCS